MDWIDLFIGSDGTLGIVTRSKLKLLPRPAGFISGVIFFDTEEACWRLVEILRAFAKNGLIDPCSLEYFDGCSLSRLKKKYPDIPQRGKAALFFEQDVSRGRDYDALLEAWHEFLGREDVLLEDSWFARDARDIRYFHEFRHDLPLMLNEENSRLGRVKIGTDMAVDDAHFISMMNFYKRQLDLSGIDYVVFGHIGDNHLHVNLLPENELTARAHALYQTLVDRILQWQGTVSAEHGIGKLKKNYFAQMVGKPGLEELRRVKRALDPAWILGVGNIL
jgi:D-lactate dehydrogenase (cytochrome)